MERHFLVERQFQVERQTQVAERRSGPFRLNLTTEQTTPYWVYKHCAVELYSRACTSLIQYNGSPEHPC